MFDHATMGQAFAAPGMDPRQWVSMASVDPDSENARSVSFTDADGNPSPYGPLVSVTLQPSGISIRCRVAGAVAGNGEAEWYPFVAGDEVCVVIAEGDERDGGLVFPTVQVIGSRPAWIRAERFRATPTSALALPLR